MEERQQPQMNIYRFNDYEWVAGPDWPTAIRWYLKETGVDVDDALDDQAHELSEEELATLRYVDREGEFGDIGREVTFREALAMMLESRRALRKPLGRPDDLSEPFFFAGTEY